MPLLSHSTPRPAPTAHWSAVSIFSRRQFNHVTGAWRQPGSSIKPFVYSAALEKGFSPATLVNDAPLSLPGGDKGRAWEPQNDDGFDGPITLRRALARSKNVVAVRLLRAISPAYARDYLQRFGFDADKQPNNLTLTLGSGSVTPQQMARRLCGVRQRRLQSHAHG